jgi:hypothetical protein
MVLIVIVIDDDAPTLTEIPLIVAVQPAEPPYIVVYV